MGAWDTLRPGGPRSELEPRLFRGKEGRIVAMLQGAVLAQVWDGATPLDMEDDLGGLGADLVDPYDS